MAKAEKKTVFTRACSVLVFVGVLWQLYTFYIMDGFDTLQELGFPDSTGSYELLGMGKYFVLGFAVACLFLGVSMWRWKGNRKLLAGISAAVVLLLTCAITVWVVATSYVPVLESETLYK